MLPTDKEEEEEKTRGTRNVRLKDTENSMDEEFKQQGSLQENVTRDNISTPQNQGKSSQTHDDEVELGKGNTLWVFRGQERQGKTATHPDVLVMMERGSREII